MFGKPIQRGQDLLARQAAKVGQQTDIGNARSLDLSDTLKTLIGITKHDPIGVQIVYRNP